MFGGIDPRQMNALMKKMGIKQTQIPSTEVIIKGEKSYVIKNPSVTMVEAQGQKTFQVMGEIEELKDNSDDIKIIMEQTGASEEEAKKALEEAEGDLAEAIMKLKKE